MVSLSPPLSTSSPALSIASCSKSCHSHALEQSLSVLLFTVIVDMKKELLSVRKVHFPKSFCVTVVFYSVVLFLVATVKPSTYLIFFVYMAAMCPVHKKSLDGLIMGSAGHGGVGNDCLFNLQTALSSNHCFFLLLFFHPFFHYPFSFYIFLNSP